MADVKTLSVRLEAQIQGYLARMGAAGAATEGFGRKVDTSVGRADGRIRTLEKSAASGIGALGGLGKAGALLGVTFGAAKAVDFLRNSVTAASDLNETVSKSGVVFGSAADGVERFGERSAKALGISKNEAIGAAATFGNLFVGMKIGQQPAADMSTRLVTLAGDLASFNNVDPGVALEALRSGLVGETEPLRRFGVNLNQASIEQEALRLGLISTTKDALTPAAKAQASYSLILQQSKTAQGDFARTSGGLANQQRILSAEWKNAQAAVGKQLLPAMVGLAHFATGTLIPAINGVIGVVGDIVSVIDRFPGPVKQSVAVLGGLVLGLYALSRASAGIRTLVAPALDLLLGKKVAQIATNEALIASEGQLAAAELAAARAGAAGGLGGAAATAGGAAGAARTGGLLGAGGLAGKAGSAARIVPQVAIVAGVADVVTKVPDIKLPGPSWLTGTISLNKILGGSGAGSAASVTKALQAQVPAANADQAAWDEYAKKVKAAHLPASQMDKLLAGMPKHLQANNEAQQRFAGTLTGLTEKYAANRVGVLDAERANDDYRATLGSTTAAVAQNGRTHDANTAAGRANREALRGLVTAGQEHLTGMLAQNPAAAKLTSAIEVQRKSFMTQAQAMGYSQTEAAKLADSYGLIPKDVNTYVALKGAPAARTAAKGVQRDLDAIPDRKPKITVVGAAPARTAARGVHTEIADIPDRKPKLTVLGAAPARTAALGVHTEINRIPPTRTSKLTVLGAAEAAAAAGRVADQLLRIRDRSATITTTQNVVTKNTRIDEQGGGDALPGKAIGGRIQAGELSTISERGFEGFKPDYGSGAGTVQVIRPNVSGVVIPHAQMVAAGYGPTGSAPTRPQVVEVNRGPLIGELHVHTTSGASAADIAHETFFAASLAARSGGR